MKELSVAVTLSFADGIAVDAKALAEEMKALVMCGTIAMVIHMEVDR